MGKSKGAERSKTRPSSSSLAASLLPTGTSAIGFGGYVGSSRLDASASPAEVAVPATDVDGEMAQHLKRLGRKDPQTKLKALSSLSLLFKQRSVEETVQIVPQWAFEYKRLLLDYNREVRRATHDTMMNLVIAVRRGLALHLRSLMGPWWFSQFDPISEVSQAARRSFEAAFPAQEKRLDALILCTTEIFLYLDENLKLTPQAMSEKTMPKDELQEMHQRVISSSLMALATLVDILVGMKGRNHDSENLTTESKNASKAGVTAASSAEKIFTDHKYFLYFLKSLDPGVRSATYSVLGCFIKHIPQVYNEGNIKTLSSAILGAFQEKDASCHSSMWETVLLFSRRFSESWSHVNIQKIVLSRFWNFLRNGCYGSQQLSYPSLLPFLDCVPQNVIHGEHFLLNFFQNLWAGRSPFQAPSSDRLAFFKAFKECFLWGLYNASRYFDEMDEANNFQVSLVDNILVTLLWHDYLSLARTNKQDGYSFSKSSSLTEGNVEYLDGRTIEKISNVYPASYMQELGSCLVEILSSISSKKSDLLHVFITPFQNDCLEIFHQGECFPRFSDFIDRLVNFLLILDKISVKKGEKWPLYNLAGPMVASCYPLIKSLDSAGAVRILYILVTMFGPRTTVSQIFKKNEWDCINHVTVSEDKNLEAQQFLQVYETHFVPWCFHGSNSSSSSRLDLLLALFEDELFSEQWSCIIKYISKLDQTSGIETETSCINHICFLAMLMEKVKGKIKNRNLGTETFLRNGSLPEHWHDKILDLVAVSVVRSAPPSSISHTRFLRAVLGGSAVDDQVCFLSKEAMILVFEEILKLFHGFLTQSFFNWAESAPVYLSIENQCELQTCKSKFMLESARFALEVLQGSYYCLEILDEVCKLVPCILAAVFIIAWECDMSSHVIVHDTYESSFCHNDGNIPISSHGNVAVTSQEHLDKKQALGKMMCDFLSNIDNSFWRNLSLDSQQVLENILIQTIRSAVFETSAVSNDEMATLFCKWVLKFIRVLCWDHTREQRLLDLLLSENDCWPHWVALLINDKTRSGIIKVGRADMNIHESIHHQFVSFIVKLTSNLGPSRVLAGVPENSDLPPSPEYTRNDMVSSCTFSRAWLAAEVLCTWKWEGGSAMGSFLPLLSEYARNVDCSGKENLILSAVNILLDGALVHCVRGQLSHFNAWVASDDDVENIDEPFLRALISMLWTMFTKDNIWEKDEASVLFECIVNKLYIGPTLNRSCLRILPFVLNIVIQPLRITWTGSDEINNVVSPNLMKDDLVEDTITLWLQKALSVPPLLSPIAQQQDLEEWVEVVISCYPLNTSGGIRTLKEALLRNIGHMERTLLLDLFRKQRCSSNASTTSDQMNSVASSIPDMYPSISLQITLAKLTAVSVGHCWREFGEDDWDFVFTQLRKWTESAVLVMEEIAENIDSAAVGASSSDNMDVAKSLELALQILDPSPLNLARTALFVLSVFHQFGELQQTKDGEDSFPLDLAKWDSVKDRLLEDVLRLFFATGVTEAIASQYGETVSSAIASSRLAHSHFWELVAFCVINSPSHVRHAAVQAVELWGLSKGPVSSLYAILFSSNSLFSLQIAAYVILSTEPVLHIALLKKDRSLNENATGKKEYNLSQCVESPMEETVCLRDEISWMIQSLPSKVLSMELVAHDRVNVFIAWAVVLSYLQSLSSTSSEREGLIQWIINHASPNILDCVFQHIPFRTGFLQNLKKKDVQLPVEASKFASSANRAITSGCLLFAIESLWPIGTEQMASLAGSVYGLMLRLLPAYVRNWFAGLRDRSLSSVAESLTKAWCSPCLLAEELSQVKQAPIGDESFSVIVNKSTYEITATYKKDDSTMDLVIHLPAYYPLHPVDVDCTRSIGISEAKQRKWLLSLSAFIRNQNGAMAEAICIWKNNFDKEFKGVEDCPICYSVFHTSDRSLPQFACTTCKYKFHKLCIYKWRATSHNNKCPLCQTAF
ncbi:E3 ubiquitin-protein ligase listerin [Acorus gramineus]|uniref:E3 ubiquitin-protein ligase listerin n=1 Tax=Acorus gramineus TaxID=55184 RepID=A0AAV9B6U6_ACOGR|nr:E3 ubiquitin-protein ligase listerin [Acorus gramineus]